MPSILNSDDGVVSGTSGLKTTGGNDGLLNIQSNGSTVVAVTGSGISVTGTVSQTGVSTFAAGTASAPSITFTGDTNTGIYSPGADTIAFTEGGAESMRIDASGNVGIGVTPSAWLSTFKALQIGQGASVQGQTNSYSVVHLTGNAYVDSGSTYRYIGSDAAQRYRGFAGAHEWYSAPSGTAGNAITFTQVLAVEKDKSLALQGATSQSGAGITFPATQSASTNANTLDDYEEGSFTPGLTINNSATGITFSIQVGTYTKIGRQVSIYCGVVLTNKGSSSGVARITNLPFTSADFGAYGDAVISVGFIDSLNTASAPLIGLIPRGESRIEVRKISGGGTSVLSDTDLTNSSAIIVGATYFV